MRTQQPSKRGSMEEEDRLSSLPDDLLHSILRELPLKHAVRTSALSRRWAPQWLRALASSRVLNFTDPELARGQLPARAAATVRRCLELHAEHGAPLDVLRVALMFPPGSSDGEFGRDVVGWIASAVAKGAREVEVDVDLTPPPPTGQKKKPLDDDDRAEFVELPGDLFVATNSLARLALSRFILPAAQTAAGFAGLRSLCLSNCHADFTGDAVRDVVSSCRALEHLSLSCCPRLQSIRIASETLRVLEIVRCTDVVELRVTAPALESIALVEDLFFLFDLDDDLPADADLEVFHLEDDMPALREVYLSCIPFGQDHDFDNYDYLLSAIGHAPVWTLSSGRHNLWFRFDTTNIQELQLLMTPDDDYEDHELEHFAGFFQENRLPLMARLFVRMQVQGHEYLRMVSRSQRVNYSPQSSGDVTDAIDADAAAALAGEVVEDSELKIGNEFVLDSLRFIKLVNFRGTRYELQLLAFVLKRAPALEHLVLVTVGEEGGAPGPGNERLEVIQRHVSAMRKASPHSCLTVCRPSQDRSQNPVRTKLWRLT